MSFNINGNSNLLKSLNSVHLPPPPSSTSSFDSSSSDRMPLQDRMDYPTNMSYSLDTPLIQKSSLSTNLTTPPQSINMRGANKAAMMALDTPISKNLLNGQMSYHQQLVHHEEHSSVLLSPAFSSPNQLKDQGKTMMRNMAKIPPPSFNNTANIGASAANKSYKKKGKKESKSSDSSSSDDSATKPPYSYATLIGMAILRAPGRRLTLSQIYSWISDTFKYYRRGDVGWQNSIRHNLSLNKAFVKGIKSKDGKGHYWCIEDGCEGQFLKGKNNNKRNSLTHEMIMDEIYSNVARGYQEREEDSKKPIISSSPTIGGYRPEDPSTDPISSDGEYDTYGGSVSTVTAVTRTPPSKPSINYAEFSDDSEELEEDDDKDFNYQDQYAQLKRSNTAIGLQRYLLKRENEDNDARLPPTKRTQLHSSVTSNVILSNIPQLQAPISSWTASASGDHTIFDQNVAQQSHQHFQQQFHPQQQLHGHLQHLPIIHVDPSPNKPLFASKDLPYTSSFSCNSNFELSPVKPSETGPLLEPLTPAARFNNMMKTPKANNFRTPIGANLKTPTSASIMRKLWNSPSYLDDFYTSPINSRTGSGVYDEDDIISRAYFGSPNKKLEKRRNFQESSGTSSGVLKTDLYGVDVCSVVKRAVENAKDFRQSLNHLRQQSSSSTEPDESSN